MNILMKILYTITMGAIRVWRMFLYIVTYIGFEPIRAFIRKRSKAVGLSDRGSTEPHGMIIHNQLFYRRIVYDGSVGFGESYMEGENEF